MIKMSLFVHPASNLDPKKITGCSQPYDIEELVVPLWDSDVSNIHQFFGKAGEIIGIEFFSSSPLK